ncbi:MAG: hypothetical protein NT049_19455 [Planctomycetota bacterium]|nr:hypothetical protein [Planctomycetota bacterium]
MFVHQDGVEGFQGIGQQGGRVLADDGLERAALFAENLHRLGRDGVRVVGVQAAPDEQLARLGGLGGRLGRRGLLDLGQIGGRGRAHDHLGGVDRGATAQ